MSCTGSALRTSRGSRPSRSAWTNVDLILLSCSLMLSQPIRSPNKSSSRVAPSGGPTPYSGSKSCGRSSGSSLRGASRWRVVERATRYHRGYWFVAKAGHALFLDGARLGGRSFSFDRAFGRRPIHGSTVATADRIPHTNGISTTLLFTLQHCHANQLTLSSRAPTDAMPATPLPSLPFTKDISIASRPLLAMTPPPRKRAKSCLDATEPSPRRFSLRSLVSLSRLATSPPLPKCEAVALFFASTLAAAMRASTPAVNCSRSSFPRRMLTSSSSDHVWARRGPEQTAIAGGRRHEVRAWKIGPLVCKADTYCTLLFSPGCCAFEWGFTNQRGVDYMFLFYLKTSCKEATSPSFHTVCFHM